MEGTAGSDKSSEEDEDFTFFLKISHIKIRKKKKISGRRQLSRKDRTRQGRPAAGGGVGLCALMMKRFQNAHMRRKPPASKACGQGRNAKAGRKARQRKKEMRKMERGMRTRSGSR